MCALEAKSTVGWLHFGKYMQGCIAEIVSEFFKAKGERERYTQLNAELQTKARRDKKAFLSKQCREIEENNRIRMGKTRDLFKKIRDTKGIFHVKMGTIKDRNSRDLTEAEDTKKREEEYTEELYKKVSMNRITILV